jgi:hypothetical protein
MKNDMLAMHAWKVYCEEARMSSAIKSWNLWRLLTSEGKKPNIGHFIGKNELFLVLDLMYKATTRNITEKEMSSSGKNEGASIDMCAAWI